MPALHFNDGSVWKSSTPWFNDGGVWKKPATLWFNDGGTWKPVWQQVTVTFNQPTGANYAEGIAAAYWSVTASQPVVWTYTKSGVVNASQASGYTGSSISFDITEGIGGASRSGTVNLTATLGGVTVGTFNITLNATGSGGGGGV